MIGVVFDLVVDSRLVGAAVAQHVDGHEPEVISVWTEVSGVCLGMAADPVQRQDERFGRVARLDAAGPDSAGVDVVLFEGNAPQISPDAGKVLCSRVAHSWISFVGASCEKRRAAGFRRRGWFLAPDGSRDPEDRGPSGWWR